MIQLRDLQRLGPYEWEIPTSVRSDMRVPVRLFASGELLEAIGGDASLEQAVNAATLPGVVGEVLVMPDVHQGYGFPIGGVAATELPSGVISPGAIGYDINCGVRLLASRVEFEEVKNVMDDLAAALDAACPSGVGKGGRLRLDDHDLERACRGGGEWARNEGFGTESDVARTEEGGFLDGADFSKVSHRARERGRPQMGTLGAGNHFIEVEVVDEVFDEEAARVMGLSTGCLTVMIHCGSRGFGHQVCTDYVKKFQKAVQRTASGCPTGSWSAHRSTHRKARPTGSHARAANYAFANRQVLAHSPARHSPKPCRAVKSTSTRSTTSPTTWARRRSTRLTGNDAGSAFTARGRPALSAPASRACRPNTARSANRCWCRDRWVPPRGCWSAPRRAWSALSGRAATAQAAP